MNCFGVSGVPKTVTKYIQEEKQNYMEGFLFWGFNRCVWTYYEVYPRMKKQTNTNNM